MSIKKTGVKITAEVTGTVANIRIVDYVYEWTDSSSFNMRRQVDELIAQGAKTANVYINSKGGDVFEASEMCNELSRFGEENVFIQIGAVVASAATRFVTRFKSSAFITSQIMIHRPKMSVSGDIKKIEADTVLLVNITEDYKNDYAKKTGKTPEQIEALWATGDHWMTAEQALNEGFIDSITDSANAAPITAEDVAILEACGAPTIPSLTNSYKNQTKMDRLKLIAKLKLAADATDAQIEAALDKSIEAEATLSAQLKSSAEAIQAKAQNLAAKALTDKKITAQEVPLYEKLAIADYESTVALIEAKVAIPQLSAQLNMQAKKLGDTPVVEAKEGWTLEDYMDKDPEALNALYESAPEVVAELEKAYFSKKD